jgi:hypothetical protein
MRAGSTAARGTRHILGVSLQALLLAAILGTIALAMSGVYKPAGFIAGLEGVDAGRGHSAAALVADPSTVNAGQTFHVRGNGFDRTKQTWLRVTTTEATSWYPAPVDSSGDLSVGLEVWNQGRANLAAVQSSRGKSSVVAETWVDVE